MTKEFISYMYNLSSVYISPLILAGGDNIEAANDVLAETAIQPSWWIAPGASAIVLVVAYILYWLMLKAPAGNDRMRQMTADVCEGAFAYLSQQYKVVSLVFLSLLVIFTILALLVCC